MSSVIDKLMNQQATLALAGSGAIILSKQCYKNRFKTVSPNLQPQTILFQVVTSQNKWEWVNGRFAFTNLYRILNKSDEKYKFSCTKFGRMVPHT